VHVMVWVVGTDGAVGRGWTEQSVNITPGLDDSTSPVSSQVRTTGQCQLTVVEANILMKVDS